MVLFEFCVHFLIFPGDLECVWLLSAYERQDVSDADAVFNRPVSCRLSGVDLRLYAYHYAEYADVQGLLSYGLSPK